MVYRGAAVPKVYENGQPDRAAEYHPVRANRQEVELHFRGSRFL